MDLNTAKQIIGDLVCQIYFLQAQIDKLNSDKEIKKEVKND